ncbi:MAG: septum formation initiator family protein [Patescibacteria group bacterium]
MNTSRFKKFGTIFLVNVAVLAFLVLGFGREYLRNVEIERSIADLNAQNDALQGKQLESLSVIEQLSSEYYLEGEARRKHGLAKEGEELAIIASGGTLDERLQASDVVSAQSNVVRWWQYFFDRDAFDDVAAL